jgi:hypothetical protein
MPSFASASGAATTRLSQSLPASIGSGVPFHYYASSKPPASVHAPLEIAGIYASNIGAASGDAFIPTANTHLELNGNKSIGAVGARHSIAAPYTHSTPFGQQYMSTHMIASAVNGLEKVLTPSQVLGTHQLLPSSNGFDDSSIAFINDLAHQLGISYYTDTAGNGSSSALTSKYVASNQCLTRPSSN